MKKRLKNKKGQIGEILVVVILLVLAVVGVLRFILPMFNQGGDMANDASSQISGIADNTLYGADEGKMNGSAVSSDIAQICKNLANDDANAVKITVKNGSTSQSIDADKVKTIGTAFKTSDTAKDVRNTIKKSGTYTKSFTIANGVITEIVYASVTSTSTT